MTSTTPLREGLPVPPEIVQLICKHMYRTDLKIARLACKQLRDAAEIYLFRHINLKKNMDSFCRLRMIASNSHLARLVKCISYSGRMVADPKKYLDFETWLLSSHIGPYRPGLPSLLKKTFSTAQLQHWYWNWCRYLHSQTLMERYEVEEQLLDDTFRRMPQLEQLFLGFDEGLSEPNSFEDFDFLERETGVESDFADGQTLVSQFTAMMAAARKNQTRLKSIEVVGVDWETFEQDAERSAIMTANMRQCESFIIDMDEPKRSKNGATQIGSMINNAPHLRTIILSFEAGDGNYIGPPVEFSQLFKDSHWPNLKDLRLQGFTTSEFDLKALLAAHATSLTTLHLSQMSIKPYELNGKLCHSSWVGMILFLHESLKLQEMEFRNYLTNEGNENWSIDEYPPEDTHLLPARKFLTFKERVERFVVDGGEFPLPRPTAIQDKIGWYDMLQKSRKNYDCTWKYHESPTALWQEYLS